MPKFLSIVCAVLLALTGCDPRQLSGSETGAGGETPGDGRAPSFLVEYAVEGSYFDCEISYLNNARQEVTLDQRQSLPWRLSFRVKMSDARVPFNARVSATCADPNRAGKSRAMVYVDEVLRATDSAAGYGATALAEHVVQFK